MEDKNEIITVLMPSDMVKQIEQIAKAEDLDRSKVIRKLVTKEIMRRKRKEARKSGIAQPTH
jgi:metal-responsive CopG/Arc/MetJ family transcriptional regulator